MSRSASGRISTVEYIDLDDPVEKKIYCKCKDTSNLILTRFEMGASTLYSNIPGQIAAILSLDFNYVPFSCISDNHDLSGYISHAYVLLLFECWTCKKERRVLCDFGHDDQGSSIGISNWEHPVREVNLKNMEGRAMYNDVYRAFEETKRQYPTYNLWSSNCKQWAAAFQSRIQIL